MQRFFFAFPVNYGGEICRLAVKLAVSFSLQRRKVNFPFAITVEDELNEGVTYATFSVEKNQPWGK